MLLLQKLQLQYAIGDNIVGRSKKKAKRKEREDIRKETKKKHQHHQPTNQQTNSHQSYHNILLFLHRWSDGCGRADYGEVTFRSNFSIWLYQYAYTHTSASVCGDWDQSIALRISGGTEHTFFLFKLKSLVTHIFIMISSSFCHRSKTALPFFSPFQNCLPQLILF